MIKSMNASQLKEVMESDEKYILVDCREKEEWDAGHIKEAKFIPLSELQNLYKKELSDKDANIIMQCRSGKRSLNACMFLMEQGYSNLTNLEGGIMSWQNEGFPVEV